MHQPRADEAAPTDDQNNAAQTDGDEQVADRERREALGRIRTSPLGDRLRQLRVDNGLTMRTAATAIGTGVNRISDWENGVAEPKLSTLARYGALFGLTVAQLLHDVM